MIFLKWEEPVEPNGLITQYEVDPRASAHTPATQMGDSFLSLSLPPSASPLVKGEEHLVSRFTGFSGAMLIKPPSLQA